MTTTSPAPIFDHLLRLSDRRGTLTHARSAEPLPEYGYSTEDLAWVLVVLTRDRGPNRTLNGLAGLALRFLNDAQALTGACRNRMDDSGGWVDEPALEDFMGDNDAGEPMWDPETGRGYDALHADGVDSNQVRRRPWRSSLRCSTNDVIDCAAMISVGSEVLSIARPVTSGGRMASPVNTMQCCQNDDCRHLPAILEVQP